MIITDSATFTDALYSMALSVLPYIGGAVAAALLVFSLTWAIRVGIRTMQNAAHADSGYYDRDDDIAHDVASDPFVKGGDGDEWVDRSIYR